MNNLVVQLLLKTGTFSTDLKTARGQIQNFQQGCQTAGRSLSGFGQALGINVGALTKFGGAVGAAVVAGKALKGILDSTQTSADAFDGAIAGCKGVVDALAVSIASADFSTFQNGLWGVFDAAKAARNALDDLQDAQLGYGMLSSKNRRGFTEAQTAYKEAETAYKNAKTQAEKDKHFAEMERQKSIMSGFVTDEEKNARNFESKNFNAIRTQVRARNTNINEKDITTEMIYEVAEIFNSVDSDKRRKEYKEAAKNVKKEAKKYDTDSKRDQYYQKHQRELIIDALLEMGNEKIQAVAQELQSGETARTSASAMRKTFDRTIRGEDRTTGGGRPTTTRTTKTQKEELEIQDESLTYWKNILAEETKYRDALVKDTDEWKQHNDKVNEAAAKIKEIEGVEEKREKNIEGSLNYYNELLNTLTKQRDAIDPDTEEWDKLSKKIATVEGIINNMQFLTKQFELDAALAVQPPTIASLQNIINILKQLRDNMPIGSEMFENLEESIEYYEKLLGMYTNKQKLEAPKTSTWDSFNQAMSNTSTIVSTLTNTFKENSEVTAASILQMVSTTLPAIGSLISAIGALTTAEAVEAGVAATGKAVSTSKHWIEAIAAVAALGAAVAAAISAASKPNIQRFANGGIVGGNSFTGDRVSAQVNSGEMILNKTQQANLFKLANGGGTGKEVTFHISGTDLVGVMNNINRKNKVIR
jgi:hypothetical protein